MRKKITVGLVMMALATSVFAAANEDAEFVTPEELGWEAGVVAPSPLDPDYVDPEFKTLEEAEKAKAIGEAELKRIQRLREGHTYLCQKKVFVNDCIERAESVLYKRTRIANQLIRRPITRFGFLSLKSAVRRPLNNLPCRHNGEALKVTMKK